MKLHKLFLSLFAGAALFAGCQVEAPVGESNLAVDLKPSMLSFDGKTAGEAEIEVNAQANWTASVPADADWVTVTPASGGVGVTKVKVAVLAGGEKTRKVEIPFKAGNDTMLLTVEQSGGVKYGTKENPFTASQAYDWVAEKPGDANTEEVYIKGIICRITAPYVADEYGNAHFYISDDGKDEGKVFQCYRCLYITPEGEKTGVKYSDPTAQNISVGDEVLVYGQCVNYKGNTPETAQNKAWLIELKAGTSPVLSATETSVKVAADAKEAKFAIRPVNVSKWTAKTAETYDWITSVTASGEGDADLVVALTENTTDAERVAQIIVSAEGADDLTLTLTQKAPEAITTLYKIADFVAAEVNADKWYQISGIVTEIVNATYGNVYLKDGSGAEIYVYGITATEVAKNDKSFGSLNIKVGDWVTINAKRAKFETASDPRQVEQASGGYLVSHKSVVPATNKQFLDAAVSSDQYYQLTGTVQSIVMDKNDATKPNAYGNLYIKDEAGDEVYIYGLVECPLYYFDEKNNVVKFSNTKTFESLGVAVGDKVTVNGFRGAYNGAPQMIEAWLVSKEAGTPQPSAATIKDFVKEYVKILDIWQKTTGTIDQVQGEAFEGGSWNVQNAHYVPLATKITVEGKEYSTADMWETAVRSYLLVRGYNGLDTENYGAGSIAALDGGAVAMSATAVPETHAYSWGGWPHNETADNGGHLVKVVNGEEVPCQVDLAILDNFAMRALNYSKGQNISNMCGYPRDPITNYKGSFCAMRGLLTYAFFFKYMLDNNLDKADAIPAETIFRSELFGDEGAAPAPAIVEIKTADDFIAWAADATKDAALKADITLPASFVPGELKANFDGENHKVTYALDIQYTTDEANANTILRSVGLFRTLTGSVKNLKVAGSINFAPQAGSGNPTHVGGIVGHALAGAVFENCESAVNILASTKVTHHMGGIAGNSEKGATFSACHNSGKVEMIIPEKGAANASQLGGIVGHIEDSAVVENCTNDGQVTYEANGTPRIGGICGYINNVTTITFKGCVNNAPIVYNSNYTSTSWSYVGGLTGYYGTPVDAAQVLYENCTNNGKVELNITEENSKTRAAGVCAHGGKTSTADATYTWTLKNCENYGDVVSTSTTANNYLGGVIGYCEVSAKIVCDGCLNDASISTAGNGTVGAILGRNCSVASTFTNFKVGRKTSLEFGAEGGFAGLACGWNSALTTAITGKVLGGSITKAGVKTDITGANLAEFVVPNALGEGGSITGVTFGM